MMTDRYLYLVFALSSGVDGFADHGSKVFQHLQAHAAGFFRMELAGEKIADGDGRGEAETAIFGGGGGDSRVIGLHIV